MRLSVVYSIKISKYGLPKEIQVVATSWLIRVGVLKAILSRDPGEYVVYVRSYRSGKGIAKILLQKINEIFQELAKTKKIAIQDIVTFLNEEAEMKLKKYYTQLGYIKKGKFLVKTFNP